MTPTTFPVVAATRRRAVLASAAVFLFFFAAFALTASGDIHSTGDTNIRLSQGQALYGQGKLDLPYWTLVYPRHIKQEYLETREAIGRHGLVYSTYELGQPLAIIPLDYVGSNFAQFERWLYGPTTGFIDRMVGPIFGALEVLIFFLFAVRLGFGLGRSLILSAIFAFATSVWPDEQSVLEHTEVAFFLLLGMYLAFRFREQGCSWRHLVLAGAAVGGAAITRYQDAAIGVAAVAVYLILPGGRATGICPRVRRLALAGAGLAPFIALDLWYNWARFGSILATGHHERFWGNPILAGIGGLVVSPGKGILWYTPVIFLLVFSAPRFARRFPAVSVAFGVMTAGFILLYANVVYWHGDPAWGPRYIYPILPYVTLPLGVLFSLRARKRTVVWSASAAVILLSFVIQFAAVSVGEWRGWYRLIAHEEAQGYTWQWSAFRYRYFWNIHEMPIDFQLRALYQMSYDTVFHSKRFQIVPPDEDPILDDMAGDYELNQWYFWWGDNEFNWWMGQNKVIAGVALFSSVMLASGAYLGGEVFGVFEPVEERRRVEELVPVVA
ncbi:MAG: phospholipid carrier-dependent glycosyltransferase [Chloroflexota bacterium]